MNQAFNTPLTVALVDADKGFCALIKSVLEGTPDIGRVLIYHDFAMALASLPRLTLDLVLLDVALCNGSPAQLVSQFKDRSPDASLIVLTNRQDEIGIIDSLQAGASGYVLKGTPLAGICDAVKEAIGGGSPLSPQVARLLAEWFAARGNSNSESVRLSNREREIVETAAGGAHNKEIADSLHLSEATVRAHLRRAYEKLKVRSRAQAIACLSLESSS